MANSYGITIDPNCLSIDGKSLIPASWPEMNFNRIGTDAPKDSGAEDLFPDDLMTNSFKCNPCLRSFGSNTI